MASYVVVDRDGRLLMGGWIVHFTGVKHRSVPAQSESRSSGEARGRSIHVTRFG